MRIFAKFSKIKLDKAGYEAKLDTTFKRIHREGMKEMIRAMYPRVPVYTGQARASLRPLGRELNVPVPISPIAVRAERSPETGEQKQSFDIRMSGGQYIVVLDIQIDYYEYLDANAGRSKTSPWLSFVAGKKAYKAFIAKRLGRKLVNLPKVVGFMSFVRITNNA